MSDIIRELEKEQLRTDLPELQVGDTVRVFVKVVEGNRERLQNFEGIVIKIQGGGVRKSFTVRRISYGIGVERTFPYTIQRILRTYPVDFIADNRFQLRTRNFHNRRSELHVQQNYACRQQNHTKEHYRQRLLLSAGRRPLPPHPVNAHPVTSPAYSMRERRVSFP